MKKQDRVQLVMAEVIDHHERFKNSYFWAPPVNARGRRYYEEQNKREYADTYFTLEQDVRCSCKNIYYSADFSVNGVQINAGDLKKFMHELSE